MVHRVVVWFDRHGYTATCPCGWSFTDRWSRPAVMAASAVHSCLRGVAV